MTFQFIQHKSTIQLLPRYLIKYVSRVAYDIKLITSHYYSTTTSNFDHILTYGIKVPKMWQNIINWSPKLLSMKLTWGQLVSIIFQLLQVRPFITFQWSGYTRRSIIYRISSQSFPSFFSFLYNNKSTKYIVLEMTLKAKHNQKVESSNMCQARLIKKMKFQYQIVLT